MASPFHIFRRNQKMMLAILTLMAMFAFVFLDPLFRYVGGNSAPVDPVIAETRYGEIKSSDMASLRASRELVVQFLQRLVGATIQKQVDEGKLDLRSANLIEYYAQQSAGRLINEVMARTSQNRDEAAVETMLLNRRAEKMNMVVSDAAINQFIRDITADTLPQNQMARIIGQLRYGGGDVREQQLFDAMRTELTAWEMRKTFDASMAGVPPAQRWEYYLRLEQKAKIQSIAVNVADYVNQVATPDDAELQAYFDAHKTKIASPDSPEPGFKQPRRERFQYFVAEADIFQQLAEVSDEEVQKYYDDNKKTMFRELALPKDKPSNDPEPDVEPEGDAKPKTGEAEPDPAPSEPKAEELKFEEPQPEDSKAEPKTPADAQPPVDEPKPESPKKSGSVQLNPNRQNGKVQFRLVADEKAAAEEKPATPADEKAETSEKPTETTAKPATDKPADDKPAAASTDAPAKPESDDFTPVPAEKYEPLDKVRDQIIRTLKFEKANTKITDAMNDLAGRLRSYSGARSLYLVKKSKDPTAPAPKEPDYVELAKKYGLGFEETKLVSVADLLDSEKLASFASSVFGKGRSLYSAVTAQDQAGNTYLVWKVEEVDEHVPTFKEAREDVLHTWKMVKARVIARKQAETYAAEAKGAGKPLAEVFSGKPKVTEVGPFSWLTLGSTPQDGQSSFPMISEVPGIDHPGEEFMKTVFGLEAKQSGVAPNQSENTFYTVQPIEFEPATDELERDFAGTDFRKYGVIAQIEFNRLRRAWVDSIEKEAGLKWLRPPGADSEA